MKCYNRKELQVTGNKNINEYNNNIKKMDDEVAD